MEASIGEFTAKLESLNLQSISNASSQALPTGMEHYINLDLPLHGDKEVLKKLQKDRLNYVLKVQETERNDTTFSRDCLFCRKHFTGNRSLLFQHLSQDHNFHVGAPDNIVFGNEFLEVLCEKLKKLECFYCEKTFKDWMVLKEHMRKKQHKQINPSNRSYDKFYIINYLELGKRWTDVQKEDDRYLDSTNEEDDEMDEMDCEEELSSCMCLFCPEAFDNIQETCSHMQEAHQFDYHSHVSEQQLDFYKQVKLVNYIRRQVNLLLCPYCEQRLTSQQELLNHCSTSGHSTQFPDKSKWDQPMYYFPTCEDDSFLCSLDADTSNTSDEPVIISEDVPDLSIPSLTGEEIMEMRY